ncbi:uncharacterized protein LOC119081379 isoform X1 [Bradysia coprophila]|uniref:uncharacterized protein LOC119081379 isoform X1 n=1 Tax=Bradysia coprophila TaxID=38358 RepID=UPI00187D7458|nr:uncharacterized protein LOC119081379 isoform X1 [Bradysia coprophila]
MGKRKNIRNLVSSHQPYTKRSKCCFFTRTQVLSAVSIIIIAILILRYDDVAEVHRRFRVHVDRQYNLHMYGKLDYCTQPFQPDTLTEPLKLNIINQNEAIRQIISVVDNFKGGVSIALVGGSGVGKTLTCNILQSNFQWPSNVLYFIWSGVRSTSSNYYKIINWIKENLKTCGAYLVIVDSIDITYGETIQELNDEIRKEFRESDISILVVFVFNLATYSDDDLQTLDEKRLRLMDNLRGITTINFRPFDYDDVERCIVAESAKLNVTLNDEELSEIFEYIDVKRSGCKLIHAKIAMYT